MISMLWGFMQKEFRQTLRDKRMWALLFLVPCLQLTLFGVALTTETRHVRLAVPSHPTDFSMNQLREHALASGWFDPAAENDTQKVGSSIDAMLLAPPGGLSQGLGRREADVQLLIDASNVTRAQAMERSLKSIVQGLFAEGSSGPGLQFAVRVQYNPTLRSPVYMVPGIMSVIMCLTTIILTSMGIAREKEIGTFETIIAAPIEAWQVILGKSIPYILLGMLNLPLILGVAILVFDVPMRGSILGLLGASLAFVAATVTIGIFIATVVRTQQQALMGGFLFLFPSILLSGLLFPVANMPEFLQVFAYTNPLTYYMQLLRNIMLKGGDSSLLLTNVSILLGMALFLGAISLKRFKTTL